MSAEHTTSAAALIPSHLEPAPVWRHFDTLCRIPRASGQEAAVRDEILAWARARGLACRVDAAGNLVIAKSATPGAEGAPGVVLQGHLDMVCQHNADHAHDFSRDPIRPVLREGWLVAEHTTLGADNGIGVALALAVLEDDSLTHPPLEVLLTVDEEAGMSGARALAHDMLQGRRLLNLDTEEWGEIYLGCAGGLDVAVSHAFAPQALPPGWSAWRIELRGLRGGHSGCDIHLQRGNAIKLLGEALARLDEQAGGIAMIGMEGGTARNALPREAWAICALPPGSETLLPGVLDAVAGEWRAGYGQVDPGLALSWLPAEPAHASLSPADSRRLLRFLRAAPHGVRRLSTDFAGVVETSNNLGVLRLAQGVFSANLMVRSLRDDGARQLGADIQALAGLAGFEARAEGHYPGWTPRRDSRLLARCTRVFEAAFGFTPAERIIHAGLECGLFAAHYPDMEMISLGPTIRGAHAPGERVEVASVGQVWALLRLLLADLAEDA